MVTFAEGSFALLCMYQRVNLLLKAKQNNIITSESPLLKKPALSFKSWNSSHH